MDKTQKRWSFIVNTLYFGIFIVAFYFFMKYAFWTVFPFIFAFIVAAILQKPLKLLTKSEKAPKGLISAILSLFVFGIIITVFVLGGVRIVYSVRDLITYFTDRCSNLVEFFEVLKTGYLSLEIAQILPAEANNAITSGIDSVSEYFSSGDIFAALTENVSKFISPIGSVISTVPSVIIGFVVSIVATCFMTSTFDDIKDFIIRQFSEENQYKVRRAKYILLSSVGKMIKAYIGIIFITTAEVFIGLSILKLIGFLDGSHIFIISFIIACIDIIPVLGTGTVVIPWSIYSFVTGNIGMGIGLLILYAVITVIRQFIEPKLVAGQVGISPVVTIIAMFIGIKIFGAVGIFILPLIVIIINLLNDEGIIHIFNKKVPKEVNVESESTETSDNDSAESKE
ncbi:MAG: sporulation integral membrane protein YtvI [Clostridia bacterium]|nr:sporulation integral membrane protein YtvI [Clostridia bacterium]